MFEINFNRYSSDQHTIEIYLTRTVIFKSNVKVKIRIKIENSEVIRVYCYAQTSHIHIIGCNNDYTTRIPQDTKILYYFLDILCLKFTMF